jgi:predicted dehydrogenase
MKASRRDQRIRYGVIGCGQVFRRHHLPCLSDRDDVDLVAACDVDPRFAHEVLAEPEGVLVTSDLEEFFGAGPLDAVSVCTPNDAHRAPVLAAIEAGSAVLCEKPLAADLDDARYIAERAESARLFAVNLPYRHHALLPAFARATRSGVRSIHCVILSPGERVWKPRTRWYGDVERAGGGALLDLGIHALDLLSTVFGSPEVSACLVNDPVIEERAELRLLFGDVPATLHVDRGSRRIEATVTARTDDGDVVLDLRRGELRGAGGGHVRVSPPEHLAVSAFLEALLGGATNGLADAEQALGLQEVIMLAYGMARPLSSSAKVPTIR